MFTVLTIIGIICFRLLNRILGEIIVAKEKVKKPFYKKWWVWLLAIIIVGAIATGGDSTDSTNKVIKTNGSSENKDKTESQKEETMAKIGDILKVGDVEFTVNSKETAKNVGGQFG